MIKFLKSYSKRFKRYRHLKFHTFNNEPYETDFIIFKKTYRSDFNKIGKNKKY